MWRDAGWKVEGWEVAEVVGRPAEEIESPARERLFRETVRRNEGRREEGTEAGKAVSAMWMW